MENLNLFIFLIFTSDVFSFHLFCRITLPLHFCEAIEICPSAAVSIVPLSWFQEDTSMSPLRWRAQNWTQYSRCGLTSAEERGRITSLSLLITLNAAGEAVSTTVVACQALLPFIFTSVCKFAEGAPKHCPIIQVISEDIQQYLTPGLTPGVHPRRPASGWTSCHWS